ncbi:unnamed protein product [Ilex paraguariensis]|uniref:Exocyst complex subunit Exo70 C-terminal domain-containing protein n=1 Tax=Ilex paraguariensis TaxID=185542 RepID=A0ABC8TT10_9AQUA
MMMDITQASQQGKGATSSDGSKLTSIFSFIDCDNDIASNQSSVRVLRSSVTARSLKAQAFDLQFSCLISPKQLVVIRVQGVEILSQLAEVARGTLSEFENAVLREPSRIPVPGGTIHPLTRAHGLGTTALSAKELEALPFCAIAYALTGIFGCLIFSVPAVRQSLIRCAHGLGTTALSAKELEALPFCAIAYALTGIFGCLIFSVPAVRQSLIRWCVGLQTYIVFLTQVSLALLSIGCKMLHSPIIFFKLRLFVKFIFLPFLGVGGLLIKMPATFYAATSLFPDVVHSFVSDFLKKLN